MSFFGVNRILKDNEKNVREVRLKVFWLKLIIILNFFIKLFWINVICFVNEYRCWYGDVIVNFLF